MNKKNKRISFDEYDAVHIYEYLRFYWEEYYSRYPEDREQMGKFGGCGLCINIGKRLEKMIGKEEVKHVDKMCKDYKKELNKLKRSV